MKTVQPIFLPYNPLNARTLDDHTLEDCRNDFTVTRDLTKTRKIKRD